MGQVTRPMLKEHGVLVGGVDRREVRRADKGQCLEWRIGLKIALVDKIR